MFKKTIAVPTPESSFINSKVVMDMRLSKEVIEKIERAGKFVKENGMVSCSFYPEGDIGEFRCLNPKKQEELDDLRLESGFIDVYGGYFQVSTYPKHSSEKIETEDVSIDELKGGTE